MGRVSARAVAVCKAGDGGIPYDGTHQKLEGRRWRRAGAVLILMCLVLVVALWCSCD